MLIAFIVFISLVWRLKRTRYITIHINIKTSLTNTRLYICARFLKDEVMSVIYSKVKMSNNIFEACKLVRNFIGIPIGEIKNRIQKGEVLLECNYLDLEELIKMRTLLESLETLGAQIYLYEGDYEVSMEFLSNTIESYKGIAEDREKIDELMFSDE